MFLSWKTLEMPGCGFLLVFLLFVGEIFAPIYLCDAIRKQKKTGPIRQWKGIQKRVKVKKNAPVRA